MIQCACGCGECFEPIRKNARLKRGHWLRTPEGQARLNRRDRTGARNPNWKGGKTSARWQVTHSLEYRRWQIAVFERDEYQCRLCGETPDKPEAHHIVPVREAPERICDVTNGITLCGDCHNLTKFKEAEFVPRFVVLVENGVKSVNARPDDAEGHTEPSRDGNIAEGVQTRSRADRFGQYRKQKIICAVCGATRWRSPANVKGRAHLFCFRTCFYIWHKCQMQGRAFPGRACGSNAPTSPPPEREEIVGATR